MSDNIIQDGTGSGYRAKVDSQNRLRVFSINEGISDAKAAAGEGWVFYTDAISVTVGTERPLLYYKNNELDSAATVSLHFSTGLAGGTPAGPVVYRAYNAATGVSGGIAITPKNRLIGSVRQFDFQVLAHDAGSPLVATKPADGLILLHTQNQNTHDDIEPYIVVAPGQSVLITVQANGNQTINVYTGMTGYVED
jgi:hypothetical protein